MNGTSTKSFSRFLQVSPGLPAPQTVAMVSKHREVRRPDRLKGEKLQGPVRDAAPDMFF